MFFAKKNFFLFYSEVTSNRTIECYRKEKKRFRHVKDFEKVWYERSPVKYDFVRLSANADDT